MSDKAFKALQKQLQLLVNAGKMTEDEMLTQLARMALTGESKEPSAGKPADGVVDDNMSQQINNSIQNNIEVDMDTSVPYMPATKDVRAASDAELTTIVTAAQQGRAVDGVSAKDAIAEQERRNALRNASLFEQLGSGEGISRLARQALKAPATTVNGIVNGVPGLFYNAIGLDDAAQDRLQAYSEKDQQISDLFGVGDPLNINETIAQNISSAATPGGIITKTGAVATDFMVDQTVRELTNDDAQYQTVFDKTGLSRDDSGVGVHPLLALPIAIAGAFATGKVVNALRSSTVIKAPTLKYIADFDKFAPDDLQTLERSTDALHAHVIDEEGALNTLLERAGVPNAKDLELKLSLNSHASANVRAREAVNSGVLNVNGRSYKAPVSVRQIYDAAMSLPIETRRVLERYLNAKDALDDVRIAIQQNMPGNLTAIEQRLLGEIRSTASRLPRQLIRHFEPAYQAATQAARDFLEGDMLGTAEKQWLDANRRHYVPLDMHPVDPTAPFVERLIQSGREGQVTPDDWFLRNRQSVGGYDLDQRASPFDTLVSYTESMTRAAMKNDARLAVIDGLLNSQYGKTTIRLVKDEDNLAGNAQRIVSVYRNGKEEKYITSQLQAQLLQFDPYVAKHPAMFIIKRMQEWNMVGPGSVTFAPITMIRDTIGGAVTRAAGTVTAGPLDVLAAVPKQLWAKAQYAIATNITAGLVSERQLIPQSLWSNADRAALATKLSNSYLNSIYHLANQAGGFDGSIMRNNVIAAQTMLGELRRSVRDSKLVHNPVVESLAVRIGRESVDGFLKGFSALFDAVQNAPRYAALEKTLASGKGIEEATHLARGITGDVSKGGRFYTPDGTAVGVDAVDRGLTTLVTPAVGAAAAATREAVPFVNPMIQGMTQLVRSFKTDPVGTMQRAWLYVGMPAFTAYAWNEMLGKEYNDYSMSRRSATDVAMNMYIGIPGLPPEQGIEIPVPHELLMFNSPYTRSLHGLIEGENRDEAGYAMTVVAREMLRNTAEVSAPAWAGPVFNMAGVSGPGGVFSFGDKVHALQEDYVGFLPQNMEQLIRTMFSANGETALQIAYALSNDDSSPFNTFVSEAMHNFKKRLPIVKGLAGEKTAGVSFAIPAEYDRAKAAAIDEVYEYLKPQMQADENGILIPEVGSKNYSDAKGWMKGHEDLPYSMPGPSPRVVSVNPLVNTFGEQLLAVARKNGIGLSGLNDRDEKYRGYIRLLKQYNSGNSAAIAEWKQIVEKAAAGGDYDATELNTWIDQFKIDPTTYSGRIKMINAIEAERSFVIRQKLELYETVESIMDEQLQAQGMLPPGEHFRIEKHLNPDDPAPFSH